MSIPEYFLTLTEYHNRLQKSLESPQSQHVKEEIVSLINQCYDIQAALDLLVVAQERRQVKRIKWLDDRISFHLALTNYRINQTIPQPPPLSSS